jgi:ABC-type transporter Mla MlaB component
VHSAKAELPFWLEEKYHVRHNFDRRRDFTVTGCIACVASQPAVGLLPEWRAWPDLPDSDHPVTDGPFVGDGTIWWCTEPGQEFWNEQVKLDPILKELAPYIPAFADGYTACMSDKEARMALYTHETGINLSGHWNLSGLVHQIESLSDVHQLEPHPGRLYRIDCSEIRSVDMSGLQLLFVWIQCIRMRGVKPELINLPDGMQQTIKTLGLENCFSDFSMDRPDSCLKLARIIWPFLFRVDRIQSVTRLIRRAAYGYRFVQLHAIARTVFCSTHRRIMMKYLIAVAAVLSAMALSACEQKPAAAPPVVVTVPGPPGPQGAPGMPAEKGATGAEGAKGERGGGTIVVVPAEPPQQRWFDRMWAWSMVRAMGRVMLHEVCANDNHIYVRSMRGHPCSKYSISWSWNGTMK